MRFPAACCLSVWTADCGIQEHSSETSVSVFVIAYVNESVCKFYESCLPCGFVLAHTHTLRFKRRLPAAISDQCRSTRRALGARQAKGSRVPTQEEFNSAGEALAWELGQEQTTVHGSL